VTRSDCGWRSGKSLSRFFTGPLRPKRRILGQEFAGEVEADVLFLEQLIETGN
jgi:hypothetical protein